MIRVGWIGGSLQLNYPQSCSDTEVVAAEIALMINNIKVTHVVLREGCEISRPGPKFDSADTV